MSVRFMQEQGLRAAREGRSIGKFEEAQNVTGAYVVEVGVDTYFDIPEGMQVIVTHFHVGCDDADEFAGCYMVGCSATAGGGDATQTHHEIHDHVGTKKEGHDHVEEDINPPLCIKYSDGHRSVSMALIATDTDTVVNFGWTGWVEEEGTLS